jgi:hypothetical protein
VFANGFVPSQYVWGQNSTSAIGVGPYLVQFSKTDVYAPDRGFYTDRPHNNGKAFNNYWEGVDEAYKKAYHDDNAYYTNGSFTPESEASTRFEEGEKAGSNLISQLDAGKIKLASGETIKIVGHSQGAAYATSIATALANSKYGGLVEFVDYLSPHQPGDFSNPSKIKGRQFSTKSDQVSSRGGLLGKILNWLNGGADLEQIKGTSEYHVRDNFDGGMGGHMVNIWLNNLIDYWRGLGIKVNIIE